MNSHDSPAEETATSVAWVPSVPVEQISMPLGPEAVMHYAEELLWVLLALVSLVIVRLFRRAK